MHARRKSLPFVLLHKPTLIHYSRSLGLGTPSGGSTNIGVDQEAALREELAGRTGATDSEAEEPEDTGDAAAAAA